MRIGSMRAQSDIPVAEILCDVLESGTSRYGNGINSGAWEYGTWQTHRTSHERVLRESDAGAVILVKDHCISKSSSNLAR